MSIIPMMSEDMEMNKRNIFTPILIRITPISIVDMIFVDYT